MGKFKGEEAEDLSNSSQNSTPRGVCLVADKSSLDQGIFLFWEKGSRVYCCFASAKGAKTLEFVFDEVSAVSC